MGYRIDYINFYETKFVFCQISVQLNYFCVLSKIISLVPRLIYRSFHHGELSATADHAQCWLI